MPLPLPPRTLRAANLGLYVACVVFVILACAYVLCTRELSTGVALATIVCGGLCSMWGIHYTLLRFRVDANGVCRSTWWRSKMFSWHNLTAAESVETDENSIATCKITLQFAESTLVLSSEILSLDALRELAADLRAAGILPPDC